MTGFRRARSAVAALFFFLGFQYSTWVARVPEIAERLRLTVGEVSVLLLAAGAGAAVSALFVAKLMATLGSRRLCLLSACGIMIALTGLLVAPTFPVALATLFVDGIAVGCLNVAMNAQGAVLEAKFERPTMAGLHALFSGGVFAAAVFASGVAIFSQSIEVLFASAGAVLVLLVWWARGGLLFDDLPARVREREGRWTPPIVWLAAAMVFATVTEGAMTDWSALYLKEITHAAPPLLPLGIAAFSGSMLIARLFADRWRVRWGDRRVVLVGGTLAGTGLALALMSGGTGPALAGFACVGLGMAGVTPCLYVAAARQGPAALTAVSAMGTVGLLAGPPVVGFIASGSGLVPGMAAVVATAWLAVLCATRAPFAIRHKAA